MCLIVRKEDFGLESNPVNFHVTNTIVLNMSNTTCLRTIVREDDYNVIAQFQHTGIHFQSLSPIPYSDWTT